MNPQEALEAMCERCHKNIQSQPSKGDLPHRECPFRYISDDYCEEYETIEKALAKAKAFDIIKDKAAAFELWKGNVLYIRCSEEWATNICLEDDEDKTIKEAMR